MKHGQPTASNPSRNPDLQPRISSPGSRRDLSARTYTKRARKARATLAEPSPDGCGGRMAKKILAPEVRFMSHVEPEPMSGCRLWMGAIARDGYGSFCLGQRSAGNFRMIQAHRASWLLFRGEIEPGTKILHRCDNRPCVNPDHLMPGTQLANMRDMARKKRGVKSRCGMPYGVSLLASAATLRYQARISIGDALVTIGRYATVEEAAEAAVSASKLAGNRS